MIARRDRQGTERRGNGSPVRWALGGMLAGVAVLAAATWHGLAPLPAVLPPGPAEPVRPRVFSHDGVVLARSYAGDWNVHDRVALHQVPTVLRDAFVGAEDRNFWHHAGVDWAARLAALWQNARAGRVVRGASTISEQSVRMLHPRPRSPWSRWLEGFDAMRVEHRFGKRAVLAFYLNQVPYADNRRGVVQAARHYFDRDLDTLSVREMLTLAVLVRAPSRLDPWRRPQAVTPGVRRLHAYLTDAGRLPPGSGIPAASLALRRPALALRARHLVREARARAQPSSAGELHTTVDAALQRTTRSLLLRRLATLAPRGTRHGAALVADHRRGVIRAWAVATAPGAPRTAYDTVTAARQPGSTLKPFVYALALERGWTAATRIQDAPFAQSVGQGQHAYRNYSRLHHGDVSLREALGNSLNVPAVKALAFVGAPRLLARLRRAGFQSLDADPERYGDGLALGNGEVTLLELVTGYATLANRGAFRPLRLLADEPLQPAVPVLDPHASTIIANILADPDARSLEFGGGGVLTLPVETAVKTGTSSDHRDAWAIGFDHRHVVGVWMGDLARGSMDRVSGSSGPALVMRALFAELNRGVATAPLPGRSRLQRRSVCRDGGDAAGRRCSQQREEWFAPGPRRAHSPPQPPAASVRIRQPGPGLHLAIDPRLPAERQRFRIALGPAPGATRVDWFVDGRHRAATTAPYWLWPLSRGTHTVRATVHGPGGASSPRQTPPVTFHVR